MIGDTLRKLLVTLPPVAAIVGDRVFPNVRPATKPGQPRPPSLVYTLVSFVGEMTHAGRSGPGRSRYQINAYAEDYGTAERLIRELAALDGYRGTVGGKEIGGAFVENVGDVPTLVASPQSQTEYGKRLDLVVWHD